jgi:hypothetical protein
VCHPPDYIDNVTAERQLRHLLNGNVYAASSPDEEDVKLITGVVGHG